MSPVGQRSTKSPEKELVLLVQLAPDIEQHHRDISDFSSLSLFTLIAASCVQTRDGL